MSFHKSKKSKRPGADRRWTLLFIGDHGNVVTLKHFKAAVIAFGSLFLIAIVFAGVLLYLNKGTLKQHKDLLKRFNDSEKQIEKLRHEKEILMARLVLAEAKAKENVVAEQQIKEKAKANVAEPPAKPPQAAVKPEPVKAEQKKPPAVQVAPREPEPAEMNAAEPVLSAAVENFSISHELENQNLNAEFKIKNTSPDQQRLVGRAVVVLKGDDLEKDQWLVMPAVGLAGDRPSGKRGKSFSIQRFRTMRFTSKAPDHSDQFQTAAVYVFDDGGELLLAQDFSVNLPPAPVPSTETPAAQSTSGENALPRTFAW